MFVSRKCLATLIHFFSCKLSTRIHITELMHQGAIILYPSLSACDPLQPVAEKFIERCVLAPGFFSGKLDVGVFGTECDVL